VAAISLGEVLSNLRSGDFRMGKPLRVNLGDSELDSESVPAELKHLSKRRNREKFYSLSSGERNGNSPNQAHNLLCARGSKTETFLSFEI